MLACETREVWEEAYHDLRFEGFSVDDAIHWANLKVKIARLQAST